MRKVISAVQEAPCVFYAGRVWKLWIDRTRENGQQRIDADQFLLEQHHAGLLPATIRLWQNPPCLVVSRSDTLLPGYASAIKYFNEKNIPIYQRTSGGTVVPHGPGVLNLSLIFSAEASEKIGTEQSYEILCNLAATGLTQFGLKADIREVEGAFCDGRFNLTIGGRKVGGTAQRIKKHRNESTSFLSHMSFLVDVDIPGTVRDISKFYKLCGASSQLSADAVSSLAEEIAGEYEAQTLVSEYIGGIKKWLNMTTIPYQN